MWINKLWKWLSSTQTNQTSSPIQQKDLDLLRSEIATLKSQMRDVQSLVLEAIDLTGGSGWVQTVQNAIMQLDDRIEEVRLTVNRHQENFNTLAEEIEDSEEMFEVRITEDKPN